MTIPIEDFANPTYIMANYNFTFTNNHFLNTSNSGAGSIKMDEAEEQFILKVRSDVVRGIFKGNFTKTGNSFQFIQTISKRGNIALQKGELNLSKINGADKLEGNLQFIGENGEAFSLTIHGVFKQKKKGFTSHLQLLSYFTFSKSDISPVL